MARANDRTTFATLTIFFYELAIAHAAQKCTAEENPLNLESTVRVVWCSLSTEIIVVCYIYVLYLLYAYVVVL